MPDSTSIFETTPECYRKPGQIPRSRNHDDRVEIGVKIRGFDSGDEIWKISFRLKSFGTLVASYLIRVQRTSCQTRCLLGSTPKATSRCTRMKIQIGFRFLPVSPVVIGGRSGFLDLNHLSRARFAFAVVFHSRTHSEVAANSERPRFFFASIGSLWTFGLQLAETIQFLLQCLQAQGRRVDQAIGH